MLNKAGKRPNIFFAVADDMSALHMGAYGCDFVNSPAFDRIAEQGVLFTRAYCSAPQCSPSRAGILTGRNIWQLEEAGVHGSLFPRKFPVYTDILEEAGYHVGYTCKGWAPGEWADAGWKRNPAGYEYSDIRCEVPEKGIMPIDYAANFNYFLEQREDDQPFCFWFGCKEPHRPYEQGTGHRFGKNSETVEVPGYLPDAEEIRSDLLDYAFEVEWYDKHLGLMLDELDRRGELDNTLVVVTADNGMPFPRAKANLYEDGTHVPLAIAWPAKIPAGRRVDDFVSLIELAPTFLEAAGEKVPEMMTASSLLPLLTSGEEGRIDPDRNCVFTGRERHAHARADNACYPCRAIRTERYLYIRNLIPERWPAGDPELYRDIDPSPSKNYLLEHRDEEGVRAFFEAACGKRPAEELYDFTREDSCMSNLASDPAYSKVKDKLRKYLETELRKENDPRITGNGDIFESYPYYLPMNEDLPGFKNRGEYKPEYM